MPEERKKKDMWKDDRPRSSTGIFVSDSILQWALRRSGKREEIIIQFPKLQKWLRGETKPTLRELEKLAKATYTPLGYFFLQRPPEEKLPIPYFRSFNNGQDLQPSPDLIETIHIMERRQSWMREFLIEQGQEPLKFVNSVNIADSPEYIAKKIRDALQLTETWATEQPSWNIALKELRLKVENAGIIIVVNGIVGNNTRRKLNTKEFRGFVLVDEYAPLVFVNGADGKAAQMFTLAHELAHILLGASAAFDLRGLHPANDRIEQVCNQVAAEFLVPRNQIIKIWPSIKKDTKPFQQIAKQFKVSEIVAAYRALNLKLINQNVFDSFYAEYLQKEFHISSKGEEGGGNFYSNQNLRLGKRFAIAVISAAREGRLLYRDAYNLTGLYGETFESYAETIGIH